MDHNDKLHLPRDFITGCDRFSISIQEALQFFISKNTVYTFLTQQTHTAYSMASQIFDQWLESQGRIREKMDDFKRLTGLKYVKELMPLIIAEINPQERDKAYKGIIDNWYDSLSANLPPKTIQTSNDLAIFLTKDFCILCDLFKGSPFSLLQYYVNRVSLLTSLDAAQNAEIALATGFFLQYPPICRQIDNN